MEQNKVNENQQGLTLIELEERLEMAALVASGSEEIAGDSFRCCYQCRVD